jgi:preprotein translocase subunit SecA
MPGIVNVYETQRHRYKLISIPFTDHSNRVLPIAASIEEAVKTSGRSIMRDIEKAVTLALIDEKWKDHLRTMDELKDSVQAASFEQRDPLVVYKMEAYNEFEKLVMTINRTVTSYLAKGTLVFADGRSLEEARQQRTDLSNVQTSRESEASRAAAQAAGGGQAQKVQTIVRSEKKVGRNDPCPCGSGKKYKHCHG